MKTRWRVVVSGLMIFLACAASAGTPTLGEIVRVAPTRTDTSLMRGGPGRFGAPRQGGAAHSGVDIVANQSSSDKSIYVVRAVSAGKVAYARINGSATQGYGYTVIIDHGNGAYTMYAHLAINASQDVVKKGEQISEGQIIAYMAAPPEKSSGNVLAEVVKPYDKIQLHFETFLAEAGRSSDGAIAPIKKDSVLLDPTPRLLELDYKSF